MKSLKTSLLSVVGAAAVTLCASLPAMATYASPDYSDVTYSLSSITAEISEITALTQLNAQQLKIVYVEDILNKDQLTVVENSLNNPIVKLNILTLQNILNLKNVLNGNNVLSFGQFLSNNNTSIGNVIAIDHFNDGGILVFCHH